MKTPGIRNPSRVSLGHSALAVALAAGLGAGSLQALTTTATYDLGTIGSGTSINAEAVLSPAWIAPGTLPPGSILRSVSIDARIDTEGGGDTYASDLFVYLDPGEPPSGGEILQVGGFDALGSPATVLSWANGQSGALGTTCVDKVSAPADFPDTIDLNSAGLYLGSRGLIPATWSGTVTVEYDVFVPAAITSFGPGAVIGELVGNAADITWTVPFGTDVTALAPTFTLSSGTCDRDNGGPTTYDFTNPVVYTVTDGGDVNVYTVTVVVANSLLWNVAGGGDWDLTTPNWLPQPSGSPTTFTNGNEAVFDNPAGGTIAIAADVEPLATTVSAASGTHVFVGGPIATGSLTKSGDGTLQVLGVFSIPPAPEAATPLSHTYPGGTVVDGGRLVLGGIVNGISPNVVNPVGSGPVTLNAGTLELQRVTADNALTVADGTALFQNNGWGATWSGPVTLNGTATIQTNFGLNFTGDVTGPGGFTKTGSNKVTFSGNNSFTGPVSVMAGTLQCNNPDALGSGPLSISAGGAKVNLNYTGSKSIDSLTLDGVEQTAVGTYGSLASDAVFKSAYFDFAGMGTVTVGEPAAAAYIISFGANVSGSSAVIDPVVGNAAAIEWIVPVGTDPATLAPEFELSPGATCSDQTSGTLPSPGFDAGPVVYTVVSQDSSVTNVYTVSVTVLQPESTLIWNLPGGGNWNLTSPNWLGQTSGLPTPYFDGVDVIFDNPAGGTITIDSDVSPQSTTFSAPSGTYTLAGTAGIASGSLVKDGDGTLIINADSSFDGGTTINAGTLRWNFAGALIDGLGTGPVTLNGGTFYLWRVNAANALTINGGSIYASNGFGNNWTGPIILNADLNCENHFNLTCTNTISGVGGVNKSGNNKLTFSGTNSYTGPTTVTAGTFQCDSPDSLGGGGLSISGGKVNLNYIGTKAIASLTLGGVPQTATGTYGSVASGATFQDDTYFEGAGSVTIGGGSAYDSWAAGPFLNPLTDSNPSVDFDFGGLATGIEWAVGGDPTDPRDDAGLTPTGTIDPTGTYLVFTYQRADVANDDANTAITVEYDADLQGIWTEARDTVDGVIVDVTEGSPADTVEVKIPLSLAAPGNALFVRLNVVVTVP